MIQHTPLRCLDTRHLGLDISTEVSPFSQFTPTASHPSQGDKPPESRMTVQKHKNQTKIIIIYINMQTKELSTPCCLSGIVEHPPPSSLCCPRPPSHHLSNLTSVYPVPASAYFHHQYPLCVQTITILSDPLYLKTPYLFQFIFAPLDCKLYQFMRLPKNFKYKNFKYKYFISRTFTSIPSHLCKIWKQTK